ncbi:MAG: YbjN domain-containing protein [Candidatus Heimdallarchaeota archaeon]
MAEVIEKIAEWLEKMDLKIIRIDDEPKIVVNYQIEDHIFQVQLIVGDEWINVKSLIAFVKDIPSSERRKLYKKVLNANWALNEVTFSADPEEGNIWVETDMPSDTTFENFQVEFSSIPFGINYFITQIAPTISFAIRDTTFYV